MKDHKDILARLPESLPVSVTTVLFGIASIVLLAGVIMAIYTIPADSEGIVLRFGKYVDKVPSGLHVKLPFGIETVITVPTKRQQKLEFGFVTPGFTNPDQISNSPKLESSMVTGDLNSALVEWVVQYRLTDPEQFLFDVREPSQTLRDISEAVMREVIGDRTIDEISTIGRQEIEEAVLLRISELSKRYQLGVTINQVQLKNVNPPEPVQPSFNEVTGPNKTGKILSTWQMANTTKPCQAPEAKPTKKFAMRKAIVLNALTRRKAMSAPLIRIWAVFKLAGNHPTRLYLETLGDVLPQAKQQIYRR